MLSARLHSRIGKLAALVAATLILPILAYAQNNQGNQNQNNQGNQGNQGNSHPIVPEANPAWVLIPVAGAVLLFSARKQFARRKA